MKTETFNAAPYLLITSLMNTIKKKILIVDEARFSRVCSAILEKEGYQTSSVPDVQKADKEISSRDYELLVTSYPFCTDILEDLMRIGIPAIILSDHMNKKLMTTLDSIKNVHLHCMIKPIDYNKFRAVVKQILNNDRPSGAGYIEAKAGL
jgi:DNA-binding NtrC family response regulator